MRQKNLQVMTSMVDLVFILLIFFLVSLTLQQPRIWELSLIGGAGGVADEPTLLIELTALGPKSLGRLVDVQEIIADAKRRNAKVVVQAQAGSSWQQGADLLAQLSKNGVAHALVP